MDGENAVNPELYPHFHLSIQSLQCTTWKWEFDLEWIKIYCKCLIIVYKLIVCLARQSTLKQVDLNNHCQCEEKLIAKKQTNKIFLSNSQTLSFIDDQHMYTYNTCHQLCTDTLHFVVVKGKYTQCYGEVLRVKWSFIRGCRVLSTFITCEITSPGYLQVLE